MHRGESVSRQTLADGQPVKRSQIQALRRAGAKISQHHGGGRYGTRRTPGLYSGLNASLRQKLTERREGGGA
jgi:hypothetical protein